MGCQSPVSLDSLQKDCKPFLHRRFVSLSVSITKFSGLQNKNRINIQVRNCPIPLLRNGLGFRMTDSAFMPSVPGPSVLLSQKDNRFWIIIKTAAIFDSFSTWDI